MFDESVDISEFDKLRALYNSKSFIRRVKKLVRAKLLNIDVVVTPQWRILCEREIQRLGYVYDVKSPSVIRVSGKIGDLYRLALWLRTASRVCVSFPPFKATSAHVFSKKISKIPWDVWLNPLVPLHFYCNVEYSKIRHEGLVKDIAYREIQNHFEGLGFNVSLSDKGFDEKRELVSPRQRVWINFTRDLCEIRVDMVGANLHQRGYRLYPGQAPLKETLAAAIIEATGWDGTVNIVDGMTGSGTLAIEAALKAKKIPPGYFRRFLFEELPSFQDRRWHYEKRQAEKGIKTDMGIRIVAVDKKESALRIARSNAKNAGVLEDITWLRKNFFNITPEELGLEGGLLVLNPPYGKRLNVSTRNLYRKISRHIAESFSGWKVAIVIPDVSLIPFFKGVKYSLFRFPHGGMWVHVLVADRY